MPKTPKPGLDADGLNSQQRLFVNAKLAGKNTTNAAIAAGYSAKTAASCGSRLLKHAQVQQALSRGVTAAIERSDLSIDYVLTRLRSVESGAETPPATVVRSLELLGKYLGMFPDRVHIPDPAVSATDELQKKRDEIRRKHGMA